MIIQHNIAALNSHRNLGINNSSTSKNLEKLSSGFRINRAGDDAAGLAISEKMRGQIRGLAMAEQNTSNGVSLIQTAEGGLNETHAILQRMRELAVQSSNGTYDEDVDRVQLEKEFQTIKDEIDRIAESTHYNGIKLLDGSIGANNNIPTVNTIQVAGTTASAATGVTAAKEEWTMTLGAASTAGDQLSITLEDENGNQHTWSHTATATDATANADAIESFNAWAKDKFGDSVSFVAADDGSAALKITGTALEDGKGTFKIVGGSHTATSTDVVTSTGGTQSTVGKDASVKVEDGAMRFLEIDGKKFQLVSDASQLEAGATALFVDTQDTLGTADMVSVAAQLKEHGYNVSVNAAKDELHFSAGGGKGLTFQIGANGGKDQRVSLNVDAMDSKSIGIKDSSGKMASSLASASIATQESANQAIEIITGATNMVSSTRADLGALQNRLEHTLNNLGVTKENLTAAESSIRDVDMAKEMMDFTKNQILVQASQSMLAQANQLPQGVLNLLR